MPQNRQAPTQQIFLIDRREHPRETRRRWAAHQGVGRERTFGSWLVMLLGIALFALFFKYIAAIFALIVVLGSACLLLLVLSPFIAVIHLIGGAPRPRRRRWR